MSEPKMLKAFNLDVGDFNVGLSSEAPDHIIIVMRGQIAIMLTLEAALALHDQLCVNIGIMEEGENTSENNTPTDKMKWN